MTRTRKLLLGGAAVAAVVAGVATAMADRGHFGRGHGEWGGHGGWGGPGGGMMRHAMMGGKHGGPLCNGRGMEFADHFAVAIEHRLKITDAQKAGLADLKAAMRSAVSKVEASCPPKRERSADGQRPPAPLPTERLAMLETGLAARLDAVRIVRPVAEKFYASLSDEQKSIVAEYGRHRKSMFERWRTRGGGPEDGPLMDEPPRTPPSMDAPPAPPARP